MAAVSHVSLVSSCACAKDWQLRAERSTTVMLLEVGGRLLEQGQHSEAMAAFDASFLAINSKAGEYAADLYRAKQHLVNKCSAYATPPHVDIYHEDENDVGPRMFSKALLGAESSQTDVLQLVICYNQALVHHDRKDFTAAMQLYSVITGAINMALANDMPSAQKLCIAMQAYNNMGQIMYMIQADEVALSHFQEAIIFAKRIRDVSYDHRLEYAAVLSNWCRVQWRMRFMPTEVYLALEEVLLIRSSILAWDHMDVASAHFNLCLAEYSRFHHDAALDHFTKYLDLSSHYAKSGIEPHLDPIAGLIFVLLIKNEHKQDKVSQDLVWGLRTLQQKRNKLGSKNPEVASVLNFVGTLLFHLQELDHSLLFFQEELGLEEQLMVTGEDVSVSVTCNNIGRILQELGQYSQAICYYQRSLKLNSVDCDADHENLKGKFEVLSSISKESYNDRILPPATMNLCSTVWYNLGLIHDKQGNFPDAIKSFKMSLKLRRVMLGDNHADVACLLYNIGVLQMEQYMLAEATECFREALRIRKVACTGQLNDRHVVKTLQKLSSLHKAKGDLSGALEACDEVIRLLRASSDFDDVTRAKHMGSTLRDIAELHHAEGNIELALQTALDSALTLRSLRQSQIGNLSEHIAAVQQETATLLLVGSLQHEDCNAIDAHHTLMETASMIHDSVMACAPSDAASVSSLLLPIYEISSMLASSHCAPEA